MTRPEGEPFTGGFQNDKIAVFISLFALDVFRDYKKTLKIIGILFLIQYILFK